MARRHGDRQRHGHRDHGGGQEDSSAATTHPGRRGGQGGNGRGRDRGEHPRLVRLLGKRFDLGLYESGTTRFVEFDKPGISYIFCNIHAQMSAVVIALTTPYYAVSDKGGEINIANVPPGRYELQVFHPSVVPEALRALNREITIGADDTSIGTVSLSESNLELAHKNKYGRDYDRPEPDSPAYARP